MAVETADVPVPKHVTPSRDFFSVRGSSIEVKKEEITFRDFNPIPNPIFLLRDRRTLAAHFQQWCRTSERTASSTRRHADNNITVHIIYIHLFIYLLDKGSRLFGAP